MFVVYVSEAGKCIRYVYFSRVIGQIEDKNKLPQVKNGKNLHKNFQDVMVKLFKEYIEVEKPVKFIRKNLILKGRVDILTESGVIEIKTCNRMPRYPYENHLRQINIYMKLTNKTRGLLIYINQNNEEDRKYFEVNFDPELFEEDMMRFEELMKAVENKIPPRKEPSPLCKFCEYKEFCEKEDTF